MMTTSRDLTVTRGLLSRMVEAILAAEPVQQLSWSAADPADAFCDVSPETGQPRIWALS